MMWHWQQQKNGGYSLVEVLIAITVLLLAVAGPMTIASKGLQSTYFARDQLIASMLAQEQIEMIIAIRNQEVVEEFNDGGTIDLSHAAVWDSWVDDTDMAPCFNLPEGCNIDLISGTPPNWDIIDCSSSLCRLRLTPTEERGKYQTGGTGPLTPFTRYMTLVETQPDAEILVTAVVEWTPVVFGGVSKQVVLTTSIFNQYGQ